MTDLNKIRGDFPILSRKINGQRLVYLDSAATSQKPEAVLAAMDEYYREHNANVHRGVHTLSVEATEMMDSARAKVAKFIGAKNEEVIFVRNATEAINLVAYSFGEDSVNEGDVLVTTLMEHHSNLVPWQELAKRKGASLRIVGVTKEGLLDMDDLKGKLDEKVKLVAITAVSNVLGTINDVTEIVKIVGRSAPDVKILVDAAQAVPHMKVNVQSWGADFVAFSGHKMMASTGIGVLWGRSEVLEKMKPFLYGGDMIEEVHLSGATWKGLPYKFEAGTPDIAGAISIGAAVDYLEGLGMEQVREHEKELTIYALDRLEELEKKGELEIYGPRDVERRGGVLPFNMKGIHAHDVASVLDNFGIAIRSGQHCGAPIVESFEVPAMARVSLYVYNTKEEMDYLVAKLAEVRKVFK